MAQFIGYGARLFVKEPWMEDTTNLKTIEEMWRKLEPCAVSLPPWLEWCKPDLSFRPSPYLRPADLFKMPLQNCTCALPAYAYVLPATCEEPMASSNVSSGPKPRSVSVGAYRDEPSALLDLVSVHKQEVTVVVPSFSDGYCTLAPEKAVAVFLPIERYEQLMASEAKIKALAAELAAT